MTLMKHPIYWAKTCHIGCYPMSWIQVIYSIAAEWISSQVTSTPLIQMLKELPPRSGRWRLTNEIVNHQSIIWLFCQKFSGVLSITMFCLVNYVIWLWNVSSMADIIWLWTFTLSSMLYDHGHFGLWVILYLVDDVICH